MAREILIIGGGIGGLASAIALCRAGNKVTVIERDPNWSVYGVGIIQQANVVRAMDQLGVLDRFLSAASGFDAVEIFLPDGTKLPASRPLGWWKVGLPMSASRVRHSKRFWATPLKSLARKSGLVSPLPI